MREKTRFLLFAFGGAAVILLFMISLPLIGFFALAGAMCGNQVVQKIAAPDGKHTAYLFQRDCGATTGFSTQASILARDVNFPNEAGNIFVSELRGDGPTGYWHGPIASMRWVGNDNLEIRYDHSAETYMREVRLGIVKISYVVN